MQGLVFDLRFALRSLRKSPAFAGVAILALGLGIGVNSAIFSVVDAVILRPLPFPAPGALVRLSSGRKGVGLDGPASYLDFLDWRSQSRTLRDMAAYRDDSYIL